MSYKHILTCRAASQSPTPATTADTTARATDPTTIPPVASGKDRHPKIWRCLRMRSWTRRRPR